MRRSLLFVLPAEFRGENRGVRVQHVETMERLLEAATGWSVRCCDLAAPELEEAALTSDVAVIHMLWHERAEGVIRRRRAAGLPTVFEISDNFLDLGSWLDRRHPLRSPLVRQRILYHAWLCDAVQVYAPPLARLFETVNRRIAVFDPYVPLQGPRSAAETGPFVVGWAGTSSHSEDLARIAPAILSFCGRNADAVFAFMGDIGMFSRHFGAIRPGQAWLRPFAPYADYIEFVRTWDVGLAPLAGHGFNNARTDTKFATYAACGVAGLLEAHPVHRPHSEHALLFEGPEDLEAKLEWLRGDRSRAAELGRKAYDWAAIERGPKRLREQRIAFYDSQMRCVGPRRPLPDGPGLAEAVDRSPLAQLRRSHRSWQRPIDYFRAMLEQQPYDYIALRSATAYGEDHPGDSADLDLLYERLCLLAPDAVPEHRRPAALREFLPE